LTKARADGDTGSAQREDLSSVAERIRASAVPLATDTVHVWALRQQPEAALTADWHAYLTVDEIARAARFKFSPDAWRFCLARALLRIVLASYVRCQPHELKFGSKGRDKPLLLDDGQLQFNLSRRDSMVLIGVTQQREIGVDIERLRHDFEVETIAQQFFSAAEQAVVAELPVAHRAQAFFNCWTRKEAFLKATGEGLFRQLDTFDVSLRPGESARLLATRPDTGEAARWEFMLPDPGPGYVAAVIVENGPVPLRYWQAPLP
jgi:4'-phosphopantetheinyl transferase